jgi:hypothetical protein
LHLPVPEQILDHHQIRPDRQQIRSESVAQLVTVNLQPDLAAVALQQLLDAAYC